MENDCTIESLSIKPLAEPYTTHCKCCVWKHPDYWKCQTILFSLYANRLPGIRLFDTTGYILAGGGVDDPEVIEYLLEILLFLFQYQKPTLKEKRSEEMEYREDLWFILFQQKEITRELLQSIQKSLLDLDEKALFWKYNPLPDHVQRIRQLLQPALMEMSRVLSIVSSVGE